MKIPKIESIKGVEKVAADLNNYLPDPDKDCISEYRLDIWYDHGDKTVWTSQLLGCNSWEEHHSPTIMRVDSYDTGLGGKSIEDFRRELYDAICETLYIREAEGYDD